MNCIVAFVGLGAIAQKFHLPAISYLIGPRCTVILCDPDAVCRKKAYELVLSLLPSSTTVLCKEHAADVANKYAVDYAIISSPTFLHFEHCKLFLNSGANVLCEKPLCLDARHASELFDLAQSKKLSLFVGYHQRFRHETRYLKDLLLMSGQHATSVSIQQVRYKSKPAYSPWYLDSSLCGGLIFDLASHYFDLVSFILGFTFPDNIKPMLNICEYADSSLIRLEGDLEHHKLPYIDFSISYDCESQASSKNSVAMTGVGFSLEWPSCIVKWGNGYSNSAKAIQIASDAALPENYASVVQLSEFFKSSGRPPSSKYIAENLSLINLCLKLKSLADL
jgi:hypothetical protein